MSSRATKIDKPPMLPPKKIAPDPDYEVIEFSNEQYSNAQPIKAPSMWHQPLKLIIISAIIDFKWPKFIKKFIHRWKVSGWPEM